MDNAIISENQFGFLPGRLTHEAIFRTVQQIYAAINSKKNLQVCYSWMWQKPLIALTMRYYFKMERAGFSLNVVQWFRSYLDRTQRVKLYGKLSDIIPVHNGIAQGTVLGPILFIFYINDIFKSTKYVKMSLFADDCVIHLLGNNWSTIKRRIQQDFDAIIEWSFRNNLRLNQGGPTKEKRRCIAGLIASKSLLA